MSSLRRHLMVPYGDPPIERALGTPLDYGRGLGSALAKFGKLREMFGVPSPYVRHAGAFADVVTLAANTTAVLMPMTGSQVQQRYRVSLRVVDPLGTTIRVARGIRFTITSILENETIIRTVFVASAGATSVYVEGRTIGITGQNTSGGSLQAHISVDEADAASAGFSTWLDVQFMEQITVETALVVPTFCVSFVILSPTGTPAPTLSGFGQSPGFAGGLTDYTEVVTVPRSSSIPNSPGLAYTLTPVAGAARNHVIQYLCEG